MNKLTGEMDQTIIIGELNKQNELHCKYPGQLNPQECFVSLHCRTGLLTAAYNSEIGNAIPADVYHGHTQRWGIPCLTNSSVNELLSELLPLAQRVVGGYKSEWDGNNIIAKFTPDSRAAIEKIETICSNLIENADETNSVQTWEAGDWLAGAIIRKNADGKQCRYNEAISVEIDETTISADTTNEQLDAIAEKIRSETDDNVVIVGLDKFLEEERENCGRIGQ
jgi:hypothetical protein